MFEVYKTKCDQCLYSSNKIVSDERKETLIKGILRSDKHFTCHKASIEGKDICCRGFYDQAPSRKIYMAKVLGVVKFVERKKDD